MEHGRWIVTVIGTSTEVCDEPVAPPSPTAMLATCSQWVVACNQKKINSFYVSLYRGYKRICAAWSSVLKAEFSAMFFNLTQYMYLVDHALLNVIMDVWGGETLAPQPCTPAKRTLDDEASFITPENQMERRSNFARRMRRADRVARPVDFANRTQPGVFVAPFAPGMETMIPDKSPSPVDVNATQSEEEEETFVREATEPSYPPTLDRFRSEEILDTLVDDELSLSPPASPGYNREGTQPSISPTDPDYNPEATQPYVSSDELFLDNLTSHGSDDSSVASNE